MDGAVADLRPIGYQFPGREPRTMSGGEEAGRDHDANWLMVQGDIRAADGRSWTFCDPCLTTWEADSVSAWLRAAVDMGITAPGTLCFIEPNLELSLGERGSDRVQVLLRLSLEAAPPWMAGVGGTDGFVVPLDLGVDDVVRAGEQWDLICRRFPAR